MRRYLRLLAVQLRTSLQLSLQYRVDFVLGLGMALFWTAWNLGPMLVVWARRPEVAGWSLPEAMLVTAWFVLLKAILEGAVQPSLLQVVEHIRKGTLDFVLLKPADAQFLVSTARFSLSELLNGGTALALVVWAFWKLGRVPAPGDVAAALALTVAATGLLYGFALLVIAAAFWVVRLDNLIYLFNSIFDAARWPATVFTGILRALLTFVIPLALMTTYPALAVLGRLDGETVLLAFGGALAFILVSRLVWRRAIGRYTSASS
jgi:ABC-2 type transport system permease protein